MRSHERGGIVKRFSAEFKTPQECEIGELITLAGFKTTALAV